MRRRILQILRVEGGAQTVVSAHSLEMACLRITGRKKPLASRPVFNGFQISVQAVAQLGMDRDVAVNCRFAFQSNDLEDIADASVLREELISLQGDNLTYAQTGIDSQGKERAITLILQNLEDGFDFVGCENFGLTRHVNKIPQIEGFYS
jgi:hypothetical protein